MAGIDSLYPKYREACNRNSSLYTAEGDGEAEAGGQKGVPRQLLNTFNEMWMDVGVEVDLMRDALAAWVSEPGDPAFLAQISAYKDFGLTLSKTELEALVAWVQLVIMCGLRCLDKPGAKIRF